MGPLASVVDGRNDRQFPVREGKGVKFQADEKWRHTGRFEANGENNLVVAVKLAAIACIDRLLNLCYNVRLQHVLFDFKVTLNMTGTTYERRRSTSGAKPRKGRVSSSDDNYTPSHKFLPLLQRVMEVDAERDEDALFALTGPVREYVHHTMERSNWVTPGWHPSGRHVSRPAPLVDALMDLATYDYPNLLTKSLAMYNRCFTARTDLFTNCVDAQVRYSSMVS